MPFVVAAEVDRLATDFSNLLTALQPGEAEQVREVFDSLVDARVEGTCRMARVTIRRFVAGKVQLPSEAHIG